MEGRIAGFFLYCEGFGLFQLLGELRLSFGAWHPSTSFCRGCPAFGSCLCGQLNVTVVNKLSNSPGSSPFSKQRVRAMASRCSPSWQPSEQGTHEHCVEMPPRLPEEEAGAPSPHSLLDVSEWSLLPMQKLSDTFALSSPALIPKLPFQSLCRRRPEPEVTTYSLPSSTDWPRLQELLTALGLAVGTARFQSERSHAQRGVTVRRQQRKICLAILGGYQMLWRP